MITIYDIPLEIIIEIFNFLEFINQIHFRQINKYYYNNVHITDLRYINKNYLCKLNDNIIKTFKHVKYLNVNYNEITDEGLKHLNLDCLKANHWSYKRVTNKGIKHMNLKKLTAVNNKSINGQGFRHMTRLQSLNVATNKSITDNCIKDMTNLTKLNISSNIHLTDKSIWNLTKLKQLKASDTKITNHGLKRLNLDKLRIQFTNKNITGEGIKHMNLTEIDVCFNETIRYQDVKHMSNLKNFTQVFEQ